MTLLGVVWLVTATWACSNDLVFDTLVPGALAPDTGDEPDVDLPDADDGDVDLPDVPGDVGDVDDDADGGDEPDAMIPPREREVVAQGEMLSPRYNHTATLLGDGRVFVFGGFNNDNGVLATGELHDFEAGGQTLPTAPAPGGVPRAVHTATLLGEPDDPNAMRVLVVGGESTNGQLATAAIYDASNNTWNDGILPMSDVRSGHTATRMPGGRVLVVGDASAEIYHPGDNTWTPTTPPLPERSGHRAALVDGRVIVVHGTNAEVFNPTSSEWSTLATLRTTHRQPTLVIDGAVLVAIGGFDNSGDAITSVERLEGGFWVNSTPLAVPRLGHSAALLDGRFWVVGGVEQSNRCSAPDNAARFLGEIEGTPAWLEGPRLTTARRDHAEVLLPDGRWVFFGGRDIAGGGCQGAFNSIEALAPVDP